MCVSAGIRLPHLNATNTLVLRRNIQVQVLMGLIVLETLMNLVYPLFQLQMYFNIRLMVQLPALTM